MRDTKTLSNILRTIKTEVNNDSVIEKEIDILVNKLPTFVKKEYNYIQLNEKIIKLNMIG